MDHIATLVTKVPEDHAEERLMALLDSAGLKPLGGARRLSNRAVEADVGSVGVDEIDAFRKALSTQSSDAALLPAAARRKQLLICDMDSTIIEQECLDELADFAGLKAEISAITERAMRGELNFEEALTNRVAMLKGLPTTAIEECYNTRISLTPGARTLVATMVSHGAKCLLVSGGFTAFTHRVAQAAGFDEHYANTLLDDGGVLTGNVEEPILGREAKLTRLVKAADALGIQPFDTLAMGDGANDLAMIDAAGLGIAFRAKPIVAAGADAAIDHTDLETALYYQGFREEEFVTP